MSKIFTLFTMMLALAACSDNDNREELIITDEAGNKTVYKVELAQTRDELTTGLMNRTSLDKDSGMIFDLSQFIDVPTAMWMKDTKIGLDMLFIDQDGMIYWIYENAAPDSVKIIVDPYPAHAVLEVNAGEVKAKGIEIGDTVEYKLFGAAETEKSAAAETAESNEASAEDEAIADPREDVTETSAKTAE